ncbi:hypothetical protein HK101_009193 [Irineochytrium annulatum]|nr:hypothetical protein HK101_009193 [Irineochytrium annulatum]
MRAVIAVRAASTIVTFLLGVQFVAAAKWFDPTHPFVGSPANVYFNPAGDMYGVDEKEFWVKIFESGVLSTAGLNLFPAARDDSGNGIRLSANREDHTGLTFNGLGYVTPQSILDPNPIPTAAVSPAVTTELDAYRNAIAANADGNVIFARFYKVTAVALAEAQGALPPAGSAQLTAYNDAKTSLTALGNGRRISQATTVVAQNPEVDTDFNGGSILMDGGAPFPAADRPLADAAAALVINIGVERISQALAVADPQKAGNAFAGINSAIRGALTTARSRRAVKRNRFDTIKAGTADEKLARAETATPLRPDGSRPPLGADVAHELVLAMVTEVEVATGCAPAAPIVSRRGGFSRRDGCSFAVEPPPETVISPEGSGTIGRQYCTQQCNRAKGTKLSPKAIAALSQLRSAVDSLFPGDYNPSNPPPGGSWVGEDIIVGTGLAVEDAFDELGTRIDAILNSETPPTALQTAQITTALTSLGADIKATVVDGTNIGPHLAAKKLYNRFASKLKLSPATTTAISPSLNEFEATLHFLQAVKAQTGNPAILPNTGFSDFSNPDNIFSGAKSLSDAMDSVINDLGEVPLDDPSPWRNLISVKAAKLALNPETNNLADVADYEAHLNAFNFIHNDQPTVHPAEFAPTDHVNSILFVDTLRQAKLITGDPKGIVDSPAADPDGNILASDLYHGAQTADEAFALTMESLASHPFESQEDKIRLTRIRNNVRKMVANKRNALARAIAAKATINVDDTAEHNILTAQLAKSEGLAAKVDLSSVAGLVVFNPATTDAADPIPNDPSFTGSLPGFETKDVPLTPVPPALATYPNINHVSGGKKPTARKAYRPQNRVKSWALGGPSRGSLGTGRA